MPDLHPSAPISIRPPSEGPARGCGRRRGGYLDHRHTAATAASPIWRVGLAHDQDKPRWTSTWDQA